MDKVLKEDLNNIKEKLDTKLGTIKKLSGDDIKRYELLDLVRKLERDNTFWDFVYTLIEKYTGIDKKSDFEINSLELLSTLNTKIDILCDILKNNNIPKMAVESKKETENEEQKVNTSGADRLSKMFRTDG